MAEAFVIRKSSFRIFRRFGEIFRPESWIFLLAFLTGVIATAWSYSHGYITAYGDAESHLNIAKRVIDSLTPGFAQLGGIWLPLPHIFLIPFVYFDWLWRSGLAGSIVSGIAFIISAVYIYKLTFLLTENKLASFLAALVFISNPNILYLQSTPMTELSLIVFFVLSSYHFILFLKNEELLPLIMAALFGFCATLSRYDGWALVLMEAGILFLYYFPVAFGFGRTDEPETESEASDDVASPEGRSLLAETWSLFEGRLILFSTLAFVGIALWLFWGFLILGDPLYFTHSQFSANSQQQSWLARGELPAYHNIFVALKYYFVTSVSSAGVFIFIAALVGMFAFIFNRENKNRFFILLLLLVPFFFNVATLFLGQSVIFIPSITPITFEWTLFNVRYGVMMAPFAAIFLGYLAYKSGIFGKALLVALIIIQTALYVIGFSPVLALDDGTRGLSSFIAKIPDAQNFMASNYDYGIVLTDDYARTVSIIRTNIPMKNIIYIGNKPYWEESLVAPEKYARWIVMQKDDAVWKNIYDRPEVNARLFKYFNKVYTSEDILIFRRIEDN